MAQRTGDYRHRVILQKRTDTRDGAGQPIASWSEFAVRWASRRVTANSEQAAAGSGRRANTVAEFRTHLTRGVEPTMRILYPGPVTTVATAAPTATSTTLTVATTAINPFPAVGKYKVRVGSELLTVTAGNGTTSWTVTRAADGTTAAAATVGTPVTLMEEYDIESAAADWKFGAETVMVGRLTNGRS